MLKKLMKYELLSCVRVCGPLYVAVLLTALVNRILSLALPPIEDQLGWLSLLLRTIASLAYGGVGTAVGIVTLLVIVQRFSVGLLGKEGYLMFALPVSPAMHIVARGLVGLLLLMVSSLVGLISAALGFLSFSAVARLPQAFRDLLACPPGTLLYQGLGLFWVVLGMLGGILFLYLCIALGHLSNKHRHLMAILWGFVLSTAFQFLAGIVAILMTVIFPVLIQTYFFQTLSTTSFSILLFGTLCLVTAGMDAGLFAGIRYILTRHLNLE